jgi:hypothetical protein
MSIERQKRIIHKLIRHAPLLILQYFRKDCCIAATRIAIETLKAFGIPCKEYPAQLVVYTRKLFERVQNGKPIESFLPGEYSVGVGFGEDPRKKTDPNWKGYNGHLVAVCQLEECRILVDLSFGQTNRKEKGLDTPMAIAAEFEGWPIGITSPDWRVEYYQHSDDGYTISPDWTEPSRAQPIIRSLVEAIRSEIQLEDKQKV